MEGLWMRERPPGIRRARARAILGKCIVYLGFFIMGVLAVPALLLAGLIYLVWCGAGALADVMEGK